MTREDIYGMLINHVADVYKRILQTGNFCRAVRLRIEAEVVNHPHLPVARLVEALLDDETSDEEIQKLYIALTN